MVQGFNSLARERNSTALKRGQRIIMGRYFYRQKVSDEYMDRILVLDSRLRSSLAIIRSLGKRDALSVVAGGERKRLPGMLSKYADSSFAYPRVTDNPQKFVNALVSHLESEDYFAVIPAADSTSFVCSKFKQQLEETGTIVGVEDWETFRPAYDKSETLAAAASAGVPHPETHQPTSLEAVEGIAASISYPVVIKPRSKSIWSDTEGVITRKITDSNYPESPSELIDQFRHVFRDPVLSEYPPLIQEYVSGEITDTVVLARDGEIQTHLQNRRTRTYPRSGGAYTLAETIREPMMLDYAESLLEEIPWTGPLMFEFIASEDDFYLMEINGRYWGSIGLSITCGVDIPWLHYLMLNNTEFTVKGEYPTGVQQRWLLPGDLLWLFESLAQGDIKSLVPFMRSTMTANHDIPSFDDPLPTAGKLNHIGSLGMDVLSGNRTIYGEIN